MTNSVTISKADILIQLDDVINSIETENTDSYVKMKREVNVSNRSYYQGQYVAGKANIERLQKLRQLFEAY